MILVIVVSILADMDYVFAHFTGILLTSILYFIIYCIIKKNQPIVYPKAILPAFASGKLFFMHTGEGNSKLSNI